MYASLVERTVVPPALKRFFSFIAPGQARGGLLFGPATMKRGWRQVMAARRAATMAR